LTENLTNYVDKYRLLLIATALAKTANTQKEVQPAPVFRMELSPSSGGIAEGTGKEAMVDPEKADERIQRLFEEIKQRHGHPLVSSYYRGLANWPEMLESVWSKIAPYVGSAEYEARKQSFIHSANAHLRDWPPLAAQKNPVHSADINGILSAFRQKFIPEMLLDAVLIKSALDGRQAARTSRFNQTAGCIFSPLNSSQRIRVAARYLSSFLHVLPSRSVLRSPSIERTIPSYL
jgi:hypothetical protein